MPGYLLLFLPLGDTVHRGLRAGRAMFRRGLVATIAVSLLAMTVATSHVATGWLKGVPGIASALAADNDPTLECIDFTALQRAFAERGLLGRRDLFVFSDWWFRAGKVDYGLRGQLPVLALSRTDPRSFALFEPQEPWLGKDGILVTTKETVQEVTGHYGQYFARIESLGKVEVGRHGRDEVALYLYRCENFLRPYPIPYSLR